jgi:hypothetical protein
MYYTTIKAVTQKKPPQLVSSHSPKVQTIIDVITTVPTRFWGYTMV